MTAGDKYVLTTTTIHGSIPGGPDNNVYAYLQSTGSGDSSDLWTAFDTTIMPLINGIISNLCGVSDIAIINLDNFTDYYSQAPTDQSGNQAGDVMPPFVAYYFRYVRTTREIKDGRKGIGLVPEAAWINNALNPTFTGPVDALANGLEAAITSGGNVFTPMIWRRAGTYKPNGVPTVYPDTFYSVQEVQFEGLGSQNSRKR